MNCSWRRFSKFSICSCALQDPAHVSALGNNVHHKIHNGNWASKIKIIWVKMIIIMVTEQAHDKPQKAIEEMVRRVKMVLVMCTYLPRDRESWSLRAFSSFNALCMRACSFSRDLFCPSAMKRDDFSNFNRKSRFFRPTCHQHTRLGSSPHSNWKSTVVAGGLGLDMRGNTQVSPEYLVLRPPTERSLWRAIANPHDSHQKQSWKMAKGSTNNEPISAFEWICFPLFPLVPLNPDP